MRFLLIMLAWLGTTPALAAGPYTLNSIMLLQPDFVLQERVESVEAFAAYTQAVNTAAEQALADEAAHATAGFIVLAVRPGGRSKVWLDFSPGLPAAIDARLRNALEGVAPFRVRHGVVVFALNASLAGAPATKQETPTPAEWLAATKAAEEPIEIGDLVDRIWPGEKPIAGSPAPDFHVPSGFELQVMEPTGGRIARPQGWFYREQHRDGHYTWTLSREDSVPGPYLVGVRIQALMGVSNMTGQKPRDFVADFIEARRGYATVKSECEEQKFEHFNRRCIETVEADPRSPRQFHIMYSLHYDDKADMVIVTIAGAPSEEWDRVAPTFDLMSRFELIDMSRFAEKAEE